MWRQLPALAGLLCLAGPAAAHPHGRIDCQAQVEAGPAGLVAAPLFYAYLKKELVAARLV